MKKYLILFLIIFTLGSFSISYAQNYQQMRNQRILNDMDAYLQQQKMKEFESQMKEINEIKYKNKQQMIQTIGNYIKEQNEQDEIIEKENKKKQELKKGETLSNLLNAFYITLPDVTLSSKYTDHNSKDFDIIKSKELANELLKWKKIRITLQKTRNDSDQIKRNATIKYLKEIETNIIKNFS